MLPRRRYRLFSLCAVAIFFLLYRVSQNAWTQQPSLLSSRRRPAPNPQPAPHQRLDSDGAKLTGPDIKPQEPSKPHPGSVPDERPPSDRAGQAKPGDLEAVGRKIPTLRHGLGDDGSGDDESEGRAGGSQPSAHDPAAAAAAAARAAKDAAEEAPLLTWKNPPKHSDLGSRPADDDVHWTKPKAHYPVPMESIITLPTRAAHKIPKIQFDFPPEAPKAKATRLARQKRVKTELERAWAGYKKHAWMHDELSPVSGRYRDTLCGWAATLVDSLDTLWIAGMKDEFARAVRAVESIDFTRAGRADIPVFETTIRYLGGLIAAFDVSGGAQGGHSILLDKAVELADILMGAFDTPNRMPVLYYQWKPQYASQPHMAGRVGIAELASLSMEFTRLAQLTAQHKYYDAVARITDALVDLQAEGTLIPGLFPEHVDASGCNRTATRSRDAMSSSAKAQVDSQDILSPPLGYTPDPDGLDSVLDLNRRKEEQRSASTARRLHRRAAVGDAPSTSPSAKPAYKTAFKTKGGRQGPYGADGIKTTWDCVPQGLVPGGYGVQRFHMGAGQDSAYEYFPKEYLLLGGREPKYQKLYEDAANAVDKQLLFQPMTEGDWDVLFPAKATTSDDSASGLSYEYGVTHLACFIGGMYALGGKLFSRDRDLELAKKLTDGCVWAYQATASGIMPETALVVACPSQDKCAFNKTRWWDELDSSREDREAELQLWEAERRPARKMARDRAAAADDAETRSGASGSIYKRAAVSSQGRNGQPGLEFEGSHLPASLRMKLGNRYGGGHQVSQARSTDGSRPKTSAKSLDDSNPKTFARGSDGSNLETSRSSDGSDLKTSKSSGGSNSEASKSSDGSNSRSSKSSGGSKSKSSTKGVGTGTGTGTGAADGPAQKDAGAERREASSQTPLVSDSDRPLSHEEYVKSLLERTKLPPGFVSVHSPSYLLRPEAIESVWYMYRVTGDPSWMDKGWRMFEATVRATRTSMANSAVDDVLSDEPELLDEMESFWIAETLKYYYLLFSEPDVISLDEWVLNTEAHPFRL